MRAKQDCMFCHLPLGKKSSGPSLTQVHQKSLFFSLFLFFLISSSSQSTLLFKKRCFHKQAFVYSTASAVFQKLRVIHLRSCLMTNFPTIELKVQRTATDWRSQAFSCHATPLSQVSLHLLVLLLWLCSSWMKVMQCFLDT